MIKHPVPSAEDILNAAVRVAAAEAKIAINDGITAGAYPLPATVDAARLEVEFWAQRERDLFHVDAGASGDEVLPLAAQARRDMVRELFDKGLRARDLGEIAMRVQAVIDMGGGDYLRKGQLEAILDDLEALA